MNDFEGLLTKLSLPTTLGANVTVGGVRRKVTARGRQTPNAGPAAGYSPADVAQLVSSRVQGPAYDLILLMYADYQESWARFFKSLERKAWVLWREHGPKGVKYTEQQNAVLCSWLLMTFAAPKRFERQLKRNGQKSGQSGLSNHLGIHRDTFRKHYGEHYRRVGMWMDELHADALLQLRRGLHSGKG